MHWSRVSRMPSPSVSFGVSATSTNSREVLALVRRAHLVCGFGVRLGLGEVRVRLRESSLVEIDLGELEVAACDGELARRALHRAVLVGVVHRLLQAGDAAAQHGPFGARGREDAHQENRDGPSRVERAREKGVQVHGL